MKSLKSQIIGRKQMENIFGTVVVAAIVGTVVLYCCWCRLFDVLFKVTVQLRLQFDHMILQCSL